MAEALTPRQDEVFAVAERLFARRGFHATSVRDIAESMQIKGGSLYAHIESKDDLLWEILNSAAHRFFKAAEPIVAADMVPIQKLRRLIAAHVRVVTGNLNAAAIYTTEWRCLEEPRRAEFLAQRDAYERMVRDLVSECIREGTFAAVEEKFATLLILSSINWIYQWYRPEGPMTPDEIASKLTDMIFNGLRR